MLKRDGDFYPVKWKCRCDCGVERSMQITPHTRGCGKHEHSSTFNAIPIGSVFGTLIVLSRDRNVSSTGNAHWICECSCGNVKSIRGSSLLQGLIVSCGCQQGHPTHKMSKSRAYMSWKHMMNRCYDSRLKSYPNYGGRGIEVSPDWRNFESFYSDMGDRPNGMQIDRIDNSAGYSASNCRWVSSKTNNRNRRSNVNYTMNGQTKCLSAWVEEKARVSYSAVQCRLKRGWTLEAALCTGSLR